MASGVIFVGEPEGRLKQLTEPMSKAISDIGMPTEPQWWAPSALPDGEEITRALVEATVMVFDIENGVDLAGYLLGAREALTRNPSFLVYRGDKPLWRLDAFSPLYVNLDEVGALDFAERLKVTLSAYAPTKGNSLVRRHANGFRQLGVVNPQLKQLELEPWGEPKIRSKTSSRAGAAKEREFRQWRLGGDGEMPIVGVTFGDITEVKGVPVWVNSENVDMQMARIVERSISARIRALGARETGALGQTDDAIFVDLAREMGARARLPAGDVLLTWVRPGSPLYDVNGVRLVAHVASVEQRGAAQGYAAVPDLSTCLLTALTELEQRLDREKVRPSLPRPGDNWPDAEHITHAVLSPLLGAGDGGVSAIASAHMMAEALREWSVRYKKAERAEPDLADGKAFVGVHRVYLLARDQSTREAIEQAFAAHRFQQLATKESAA